MYTTIKISDVLKKKLEAMKFSDSETYEEVIEDLIEDHLTLNDETKARIEKARKEITAGKFVTFENIKK